jgi:hypothetical protein
LEVLLFPTDPSHRRGSRLSSDPAPVPPVFRFGDDLELDRSAYQLRRAGRELRLERIPLDILFLLAERPGQLVSAIDRLRSVRAVDPTMSRTQLLVAVYTERGMFEQALAEEERWRPSVPVPIHWATLAYVYGRAGRTDEARRAIGELVRASDREPVQARVFAWSYAGVRDVEQTVAWLEKAYAEHSGEMVALKVNPAYDFLRDDPRFQRLLEGVGLGG